MNEKLNAPILENKIVAQINKNKLTIPFMMNRGVSESQFDNIELILKSAQSNLVLCNLTCSVNKLYKQDNQYWAVFEKTGGLPLQIGQYYKIQIAYSYNSGGEKIIGFYSNSATFKFTSEPVVTIKDLLSGDINLHKYTYTGSYKNSKDPSEKVYSYQFYLYDSTNTLVSTSGECLHNASKDTDRHSSIDDWNVKYGLETGRDYLLHYEVTTINGLKCKSETYKIVDGQTVPSNIFKYSNFVATNIPESACIQLSLKPKEGADRKLMNGQFVLLRSSSEDGFSSWQEVTRFILAAWDTSVEKIICNDYSVAQGEKYIYGLQAYNNNGVYSLREETPMIQVDFEDMFLSDGERQLRIQFNPKVTSIKNTILESKMDTLGGKYPYFFRNGNVKYKEFPISGLISVLMDETNDFIHGIKQTFPTRYQTPAADSVGIYQDAAIQLTADNFKNEREFKLEVLEWLTNGQPKVFRSPGEGNFIVRLMNTSLSPTDSLGRMIHTFSCTAYEVADYTFENLRKYGMMVDDYIETRNLQFFNKQLENQSSGKLKNLNACVATLNAKPSTQFFYKLRGNTVAQTAFVGTTGTYVFPNEVLQENPLIEIWHADGKNGWKPGATLTYAQYITPDLDAFSYVKTIAISDKIDQWIGQNREEINYHFDKYNLITSIGLTYYLNISQRPKVDVTSVVKQADDTYKFKIKDIEYTPGDSDLIFCSADNMYYCGKSRKRIGNEKALDFNFQLRDDDLKIDLKGTPLTSVYSADDNITFVSTGGRLVLTNVSNVNCLYLGNALFVDIAYQEITKTYTAEDSSSTLVTAKNRWLKNKTDANYTRFCNTFKSVLNITEEDLLENAL